MLPVAVVTNGGRVVVERVVAVASAPEVRLAYSAASAAAPAAVVSGVNPAGTSSSPVSGSLLKKSTIALIPLCMAFCTLLHWSTAARTVGAVLTAMPATVPTASEGAEIAYAGVSCMLNVATMHAAMKKLLAREIRVLIRV